MASDAAQEQTPGQVQVRMEAIDLSGAQVFYANGAMIQAQVYGVQLIFSLKDSEAEPPKGIANIHMSPELAKVLGRLLRQAVAKTEATTGMKIPVPDQILDALNIRDLEE